MAPTIHGEDIPEDAHFVRFIVLAPGFKGVRKWLIIAQHSLYGPLLIPAERFSEEGGYQNNIAAFS